MACSMPIGGRRGARTRGGAARCRASRERASATEPCRGQGRGCRGAEWRRQTGGRARRSGGRGLRLANDRGAVPAVGREWGEGGERFRASPGPSDRERTGTNGRDRSIDRDGHLGEKFREHNFPIFYRGIQAEFEDGARDKVVEERSSFPKIFLDELLVEKRERKTESKLTKNICQKIASTLSEFRVSEFRHLRILEGGV